MAFDVSETKLSLDRYSRMLKQLRLLRAIRTELGEPLMVVTKGDRFLRSCVTDPKDEETVILF